MSKKVILLILDGWGLGTNPEVSAIAKAKTPFMDKAFEQYTHSKLEASGLAVGLPEGQMGNSEVGHTNIGAGRVVYQDLVRINKACEKGGELYDNQNLSNAFDYAKNNNKKVHFIGLLSDGGVHSHIDHLKSLCSYADEKGLKNVFIHAFTDGRDTSPNGGVNYLQEVENHIQHLSAKIASVVGRYYAMDRDKRWERVKLAYNLLVKGEGTKTKNLLESLKKSYQEEITDEFIKPIVMVDEAEKPLATIEEDDVVLFFNFRNDRGRQLTQALTQTDFEDFGMKKLNLYYLTMTIYDEKYKNVQVLFEKDNLHNTLGEIIAKAGKKQIRIAETEKYPHVTFFFSGGRETEFEGEKRILCNSPKVATYDLQPEMSANDIKNAIIKELNTKESDFICLNFANADMVGHTGVFDAAVQACEAVDMCAGEVVASALENGYTSIVIADHGNSDIMINPDGTAHTAHTTNLVPCILVDNDFQPILKDGKLGDLAPTILKLMGIEKPKEMTGFDLF
ncbi:MAG: 2,3-bisphosphoglycerate-independent phosphoglycerate mutase [Bacteroidetes bacterium]|nr:MAG: 2,3-bisphosphoglycerate-independent phosphoglycerate mutase [Bacteroidota bacterium]TAG88082.1 MAG: 2,3-bisphosphoglycerate-independent phosphoglycerate mutase [Bacteroidota bacterium]